MAQEIKYKQTDGQLRSIERGITTQIDVLNLHTDKLDNNNKINK